MKELINFHCPTGGVPDDVHSGRPSPVGGHSRRRPVEAGPSFGDVSHPVQPVAVGRVHLRGEEGRELADTRLVLRAPAVEHHQPPVRAAHHLLPVPLDRLSVRDLDQRLPTVAQWAAVGRRVADRCQGRHVVVVVVSR